MNANEWLSQLKRLLDEENNNLHRVNESVDTGAIYEQLSTVIGDDKTKRVLAEYFIELENIRLKKLFSGRQFYEKNMRCLYLRERELFQKVLNEIDKAYTGDAKIARDWTFGKRERIRDA